MVAKPPVLPVSNLDMFITGTEGGILDVNIDYINAGFLVSDPTWVPYLKINNYTSTSSVELDSDTVSINTITTDVTKNITFKELTNNFATITTSTAHGFEVGDLVTIAGVNATFNGSRYITEVPSTTTFIFGRDEDERVADVPYGADTGTATVTNESHDTLTLTVSYDDAYNYVGFLDPGTWDLYATRPTGGTTETVYITSGNLTLRLANNPVPTYTIGN
jgi:hypothetical protein